MAKYDFSGYATRNDLKCSDGRTIRKDAFKENDGQMVPLVWQHMHTEPSNVLGHALLENREDGVYTFGVFNDTDAGKNAKMLVEHGDITALSIYANGLLQKGTSVLHGAIREVSLVLAGANPGALIDNLAIQHSDGSVNTDETEAIIYTGEDISLPETETETETELEHADKTADEKTVKDVFDTLNDEQKQVVYFMLGQAIEDKTDPEAEAAAEKIKHSNEGGQDKMKKNVFDATGIKEDEKTVLSHSDSAVIFADAKRYGSLKESALAHGITDIDFLFPDATSIDGTPQFIQREMGWVQKVMGSVHHTPFSRIKSVLADITELDARAKGYITGNLKVDEVFALLKRTTSPTTIYKKQKLDRDDVVDITDFDVVGWLKSEMRLMLDEEIARAVLIGDGRLAASDEKVNEANIRPIWTDAVLYAYKTSFDVTIATIDDQRAKLFIRSTIKARKNYKGSGDPTLYVTEDMLTDCLLMEDTTGRTIYDSVTKLATALRVKEIVTVPVMELQTRIDGANTMTLHGIIVNLNDYNIGADKGGAVNMFDDFDIDYNAQKYLIETRVSGALTKPNSAIVIESKVVV